MELKTYQKNVISDLTRFLDLLTEKQDIAEAYNALWNEKGVMVGFNGMPNYRSTISNVPEVCIKVPTGGGKTFIAANAIKPIFDSMPSMRSMAVVWLVPSEAILTQTYKALTNSDHPYRQKLDVDFGSRVEVYSKAQLLSGQNFNPTAVTEQLSVFVLSYDSFRASRKEGRKAFQENGNLAAFSRQMTDRSVLLDDTDETALIQVVRSLNPVVIVDESHHATSALSIDMLRNFNPCFVLDLTATPKEKSNVISFVDAIQLKKENMVKLPVIVYNRKSQSDVYSDAISIRAKLEAQAKIEQAISGRYTRPIVLFQAQPRNREDSTTYDKIKDTLIEAGIPSEQIAIKTGDKDEIKNIDLMSAQCPIRYIITVNALKEGWDCPFAYVLATVANRTSAVDVEQILGRVLRLPSTRKFNSNVLNLAYVITSSADFHRTLEKVVDGLQNAGFGDMDYRAKDLSSEPATEPVHEQIEIGSIVDEEDIPEVDAGELRIKVETVMREIEVGAAADIESDDLFAEALAQNDEYEVASESLAESAFNTAPIEVRSRMNVFKMVDEFSEEASALRFPQFMLATAPSIFSDNEYVKLETDHLTAGFTLRDKDAQIDFNTVDAEIARVDVDDANRTSPKAWRLTGVDSTYFKEWFNAQPSEVRLANCKNLIKQRISRINCINDRELQEYIDRVIITLTEDQLTDFEQSPYPYILKIEAKIKSLIFEHSSDVFDLWLEQEKIKCLPNYALDTTISPTAFTSTMPNSLYTAEEDMNEYERKVVWEISSLENIKWWHRNMSVRGFDINGSVRAFPDIIAMTKSGKILMIEPKGDHLDNDASKAKAIIGSKWTSMSGSTYRYFMVFQSHSPIYSGAYSFDRFMEIVKEL